MSPGNEWIGVVGIVGSGARSGRPVGVLDERPISGEAGGDNANAELGGGEECGLDVVP